MEPSSPFNNSILEGKVALITGGGSGIGLEIATQFGRHGAQVAIMGRRRKVLDEAIASLTAQSIQVVGFDGDVRKTEDAIRVVECTVAQFGKLDILVNGAAGNFMVPAEHLSQNGFRTVLDIDAVGTFTMCHAALKYLKTNGEGKGSFEGSVILNISATLQYSAAWYQLHLAAAKAAIDSMTRSLALEWGTDYGVRVNGIAPGPIADTPGMSKLDPEGKFQGGLGQKWDIAMAAIYLVSDAGQSNTKTNTTYLCKKNFNQSGLGCTWLTIGLQCYDSPLSVSFCNGYSQNISNNGYSQNISKVASRFESVERFESSKVSKTTYNDGEIAGLKSNIASQ